MAVALLVAAGSGERLGAALPKALVPVAGRPMLLWSLSTLGSVPAIDAIVVALPAAASVELPAGVIRVDGGATRSESVRAALAAAPAGDPVVVHDAARPLASVALFAGAIELYRELDADAATRADAVIAAARSANTLKRADAGYVIETLDRSEIWQVETPQVFRRAALETALNGSTAAELAAATDDASLIEAGGGRVAICPSEDWNLKITWPRDLEVADLLLSRR